MHSGRACVGSAWLRRVRHRAERRHRQDKRQPCCPARRRRSGTCRRHFGGVASRCGPPARMDRLRGLAGRHRADHRKPGWRGDAGRRRPGAGIGRAFCYGDGGAGSHAARSRSSRVDRGAIPRRRAWSLARRADRRDTACAPWPGCHVGRRRPVGSRDARALHLVCLRADQDAGSGRGGVRQSRTAGRHPGRHRLLREPCWSPAARRRHGDPVRHRAEQLSQPQDQAADWPLTRETRWSRGRTICRHPCSEISACAAITAAGQRRRCRRGRAVRSRGRTRMARARCGCGE